MSIKLGAPILVSIMFTFALLASFVSALPSGLPYNITDSGTKYFGLPGCEAVELACDPNHPDFCVAMIYCSSSNTVTMYYSINGFEPDGFWGAGCFAPNCVSIGSYSPTPAWNATFYSYYAKLPMDIIFDDNAVIDGTRSYFMFADHKTYRFNPSLDFFGICPFCVWAINDTAVDDIIIWGALEGVAPARTHDIGGSKSLAFNENDPQNIFTSVLKRVDPVSGPTYNFAFQYCTQYNISRSQECNLAGGCYANCVDVQTGSGTLAADDYLQAQGFAAGGAAGMGDWYAHFKYEYIHTSFVQQGTTGVGAFPPPGNGTHHYLNGRLYYVNLTGNTSADGMWTADVSGNFAAISNYQPVYVWDSSIQEQINFSDSQHYVGILTAGDWLAWSRDTNSTQNGIWFYQEEQIPVELNLPPGVNSTIFLSCEPSPGVQYSDQSSGSDLLRVATPCSGINNITVTSFYEPVYHVTEIDTTVCSLFSIVANYFNIPYYFEFNVIDYELGTPIVNATVDLFTYGSAVTDSQGKASILISPVNNAYFTETNPTNCSLVLDPAGDAITYTVSISKSGYQTINTYITPASDFDDLEDKQVFALTKEGAYLNVSILSTAGISLSPCNYYLSITGADKVFEIRNGIEIYNNNITDFPARIRLEDDNSTLNITLSLYRPDGTWNNITDTITLNNDYDYEFYMPAPRNLPCLETCDCPDDVCLDQYHYQLISCDGNCSYSVTDCGDEVFCDGRVGCFQSDTTMECDLLWIEADTVQCPNYCLTNNTMVLSQCGLDSFCKNKTISCVEGCDDETGACAEMRYCLQPEPVVFKVQNSPVIQSQTCSLNNIGQKYCLDPISVPFNGSNGAISWDYLSSYQLTTLPDGWSYTTNTTNETWDYWSPLVECTSSCEPVVTYCEYGCDQDTLQCFGKGSDQFFSGLPSYLQFLFSATFLWTLFALIVGAILTFLPSKISINAQPTPEIGLASIFVIYIIGLAFGFVDPIIGLIVIIGLGLGLAKVLSSMFS